MIVVKVGGSLFDHPRLATGLRLYLDSLAPADVLLVPGGGDVVEAVRKLDAIHGLGDELCHELALRGMGVTGDVLGRMLQLGVGLESVPPTRLALLADLPLKGGGHQEGLSDVASPLEGEVGDPITGRRVGGKGDAKDLRIRVVDCLAFTLEDDSRLGALPHSWDVTSDSIAARVAVVNGAERLVLLKSVDVPPGTSWQDAAARGWVDPHFPLVVADAAFSVEIVNFRRVLDSLPGG